MGCERDVRVGGDSSASVPSSRLGERWAHQIKIGGRGNRGGGGEAMAGDTVGGCEQWPAAAAAAARGW